MAKGKYKEWLSQEGQEKLEALAAIKTDVELAAEMGIQISTFYQWLKSHDEIKKAVERGRTSTNAQETNRRVELSLLDRCLGGAFPVVKGHKIREVVYDERGKKVKETERIEMVTETTYVPADTAAIRFWLTNRQPERWKNKQELSGDVNLTGSLEEYLKGNEGGREF